MREDFQKLLAVRQQDYRNLFRTITHDVSCGTVPCASIRLHYIQQDNSGEPQVSRLIDTILNYVTDFCLCAEKRPSTSSVEHTARFRKARSLFRNAEKSGQVGELLIYFLIEAVLEAPQILKKMLITTNPNDERKGSDGVHMRWDDSVDVLEVIFGEAKIWKDFSKALTDAFKSMTTFHLSKAKDLERAYFTSAFSSLSEDMKIRVVSYTEGENIANLREVHACLIGYNWDEYKCLTDSRREAFVKEFESRYLKWAKETMEPKLSNKVSTFAHKHLRLEFFFVPFVDVEAFRKAFNAAL